MADRNYFINGITELLILSVLKQQDSYVYDITQKIKKNSMNLLNISQNTIYTATYKLNNEGKLKEYSKLVGKRRTRIYYQITEEGVHYLDELMGHYLNTTNGVQLLLNSLNITFGKEDTINEQAG